MENTNDKLLPCPFCGSADIDPDAWASKTKIGPDCNECGCLAESADAWNRRAAPAAGTGAIVRYDMTTEYNKYACEDQVEPVVSDDGEWVKFADHVSALAALAEEARREAWKLVEGHTAIMVRRALKDAAQRTAGGGAPLAGGGGAYDPSRADHVLHVSRAPVEEAAAQADGVEDFERAHRLLDFDLTLAPVGAPNRYLSGHTQSAWEVWQKHAAAPTAQPTPPDDERAAFEAWAITDEGNCDRRDLEVYPAGSPERTDGLTYRNPAVQRDFDVWLACAALRHPPVPNVGEPCAKCGGAGVIDDGEIDCYPNGEPFMCGPVKCVKDCPCCTSAAQPTQAGAEPAAAMPKTWQERIVHYGDYADPKSVAMAAEIYDLRARLASAGAGEDFDTWFEAWRRSTWKPLPSDIANGREACPAHWNTNPRAHMQIAWSAAKATQPPAQAPARVDGEDTASVTEFSYSTDEENYQGAESSRDAAIELAISETDDDVATIWTGRNTHFKPSASRLMDWLIESLQEQAYDECGEWAENYLRNVTDEEVKELGALILDWVDRVDDSQFFTVTDVQEHDIAELRAARQDSAAADKGEAK